MLAVHFGAGNIGRGFIGQLLHQAGYEVCFVDVNRELVDEINRRQEYVVKLAKEGNETTLVQGVRAIHGQDQKEVAKAIAEAELVTTAVGPAVLPLIAPVIAEGLALRLRTANHRPLNVIACENMIGASSKLKELVFDQLSKADQEKAAESVGFPDAAVDRIVPLQKNEDRLLVTVEPFFEWVVDQSKIIGEIPRIGGITYVNDLTPYIERKLYTVNTGHAVIAYLGYQMEYQTIDQAVRDEEISRITLHALHETGALLIAKYQFDQQQHSNYIEKIMQRFSNPFITDEVTRVGRSPIRKLSPNDRLSGPAMQACQYGIIPTHLAAGIAAALLYDYAEDNEAMEIQEEIKKIGLESALHKYTHIPYEHPLFQMVIRRVESMR
ncbi:MAG: mannitol-1-phosphate 5-dehydrogenase [Brevibacillus sp.]|nr:mannitol-1-phosphate 5-dehydrogenase [Brevibacillus sp.]